MVHFSNQRTDISAHRGRRPNPGSGIQADGGGHGMPALGLFRCRGQNGLGPLRLLGADDDESRVEPRAGTRCTDGDGRAQAQRGRTAHDLHLVDGRQGDLIQDPVDRRRQNGAVDDIGETAPAALADKVRTLATLVGHVDARGFFQQVVHIDGLKILDILAGEHLGAEARAGFDTVGIDEAVGIQVLPSGNRLVHHRDRFQQLGRRRVLLIGRLGGRLLGGRQGGPKQNQRHRQKNRADQSMAVGFHLFHLRSISVAFQFLSEYCHRIL
jgi:hypothetical protein